MHRRIAAVALALICMPLACALSGCAAPLPDRDARAAAAISAVAARTSGVDPADVTSLECWRPSQHPIEEGGTAWRVICRVHFTEDGGARWRDTTCVGDTAARPMLERCYRWTPYTHEPAFEDHPSIDVPLVAGGLDGDSGFS